MLRQLWLIKIATIVVGVATIVFIATIVVSVATIVVFCDNCGFLRQLWLIATIVNIATILITNQGTTLLKTDIIITFYAEIA